MTQWEYLSGHLADLSRYGSSVAIFDGTATIYRTFNQLGVLGWELVAINDNIAYFKREKIVTGIYYND